MAGGDVGPPAAAGGDMLGSGRDKLLAHLRQAAPAQVPRSSIRIVEIADDVDHPDRQLVIIEFTICGEVVSRDMALPRELLA